MNASISDHLSQHARALKLHVEDLLLLMNASRVTHRSFAEGGYPLPLRTFDKAEPFLLQDVTHTEFSDAEAFTDVSLRDLATPFDFTGMGAVHGDSALVGVHRLSVVRRPLFPVRHLTRYVVAHRFAFFDRQQGHAETGMTYYGSNTGESKSWRFLGTGEPLIDASPAMCGLLIFALGLHFNRDYLWHAYLKWPGAEAGVMVPTTPAGARSLFRLRDYEAGASRRKALIHWVSEHSRRVRKDTEEETRVWVREHTRGVAKFTWQDMEGAIYPAAYDLRRLAEAKGGAR